MPCGLLRTEADGRIGSANRAFREWTGFSAEELAGRRFQDLLSGPGRIYHETHFAPLLHMQDAVSEIALELVCADGTRLPVLVNATLRRDDGGRPLLVQIAVFRATDRRRYERELLDSRRRERAALERTERLQRLTSRLASASGAPDIVRLLVDEIAAAGVTAAAVALHEDGPPQVLWDDAEEVPAEQRAHIEACAAQCGQALERARLHDATAAASRRADFLARLGRVLDEVPGLRERAERLTEHVRSGLAEQVWVRITRVEHDQRHLEVRAWDGATDGLEAALRDVEGGAGPQLVAGAGAAVLPLPARGQVLGALAVGGPFTGRAIGRDDLPFLAEIAERAGLALENARLYEQERTVAHALQGSLLAGEPPADGRCAIATHYRPGVGTLEVGGDFYDSFWVREDVVGLVVGDVVGRGLSAATGMGQLRSGLRALAGTGLGPAQVLEHLDGFVDGVPAAQAATAVYFEVDLSNGEARYACAGHPPPLLAPQGGEPLFLEGGRSIPLGLFGISVHRGDARLSLGPGDRLLLYTDGLVETRHESIDAGLERLRAAVARGTGPAELATELTGGTPVHDDVCLLCFELRAPA